MTCKLQVNQPTMDVLKNAMSEREHLPLRSICPVACTLDLLGDKWTLLVVRDLLLGKTRYGEFIESGESIPTNILADRLKRLYEHKLIDKQAYQSNPTRYQYRLTDKGAELGPILLECVRWGEKHVRGSRALPEFNRQLLAGRADRKS